MHGPVSPAFRVENRSLAELDGIADEWRELAARALEPNVFYRPEFALAAAPVFGAGVRAILVRGLGNRLEGLFPARIERPRGALGRALVGWTHPFAPLGVPLVDRDNAQRVIAAWLDHLSHDSSMPRRLLLPFVPDRGDFAAALGAVLADRDTANAAFGRHRRALLDPGDDRDGYIARAVSHGRRKELRRQRRRLEETAPVAFSSAAAADVGAALDDFLALEAAGWKGAAGTAAANDPAVRDFMQKAVTALAANGCARIDRLTVSGRAVAVSITLSSGDTAWCWKIAYDEGVARASPGVQLVLDLTESLLAQPSPVRVDSCATADHPMIDHIWRERLPVSDRLIALRPSLAPFAVTCRIEAMRRAAVAAAKAVRDRARR